MNDSQELTTDRHSDRGAAMVEYGLILALVVLVALIGVGAFGVGVTGLWDRDCDQSVAAMTGQTCN